MHTLISCILRYDGNPATTDHAPFHILVCGARIQLVWQQTLTPPRDFLIAQVTDIFQGHPNKWGFANWFNDIRMLSRPSINTLNQMKRHVQDLSGANVLFAPVCVILQHQRSRCASEDNLFDVESSFGRCMYTTVHIMKDNTHFQVLTCVPGAQRG